MATSRTSMQTARSGQTARGMNTRRSQPEDNTKTSRRADPLNFKALFGGVLAEEYLNRKHENSTVDVNPRNTTIHDAARAGDISSLEYHLQKTSTNMRLRDDQDRTPLMIAACNGHPEVAERLLDEGTDPNLQNNAGLTALMWACLFSQDHMVQILVERGADVNLVAKNGRTALQWACELERDLVVKFLIANGSDPNHQDNSGWTAPHYCCFRGNLTILKLLIQEGADVNLKKQGGKTILHVACYQKHADIVEFLVGCEGLQPNIVDDVGWTPLKEIIRSGGDPIIVDLLESVGAKLTVPTNAGDGQKSEGVN